MASYNMKTNVGKAQLSYATQSGNASILSSKLNYTDRKSTPDSEVLASSDDEGDVQRASALHDSSTLPQKPMRRSSWLNDTNPSGNQLRRGSFTSALSPNTLMSRAVAGNDSHLPPTAIASGGRAHPGALGWNQGIWGADANRKDATSRLAEVLPSPTSTYPPNGGAGFHETAPQNVLRSRESNVNSTIPFSIPLQPTLKTIRSQSYSVGQQDYEAPGSPGLPSSAISSTFAGRNRQHSAALQHRPSRPSMLSEVSNENIGLGNVKEVEDDEDGSTTDGSSLHGGAGVHQVHHTKQSYEALARELNMLRQRENARRPRAPTVGATSANYIIPGGHGFHESLIEESDYAVDEVDEVAELQDLSQRGPGRRMSEYSAVQGLPPHMIIENRKLESLKKGAWSTSAGSSDNSQSRRHSFADTLPTRQGSVSSIGDTLAIRETAAEESTGGYIDRYQEGAGHNANEITNSYFSSGSISFPRPPPEYRHTSSLSQPAVYRPSTMHPHFGGFMHSQARRDQALYIVSFKASRGDVFYVQENTGLQVRVGDLVIVEADRGWDLGTVAHAGLNWDEARKQKENADEEHYKWLMMYSQFSQEQSTDAPCAGMMFVGNGEVSGVVGGVKAVMAPHMKAMQDSRSGEIQPKIIKRVAQAHEVAALRQKEGDEAKAKRVCIQKAREHGIPMEILDCDFQMDGKKIIFYYYAESYVNFNILVTDLFKVYKTRIWMSAVNPASFGTISAGHQAPSGIGPGAIGVRNGQQQDQIQQYSSRGYDSGYGQTFPAGSDRALMAPQQSYQATSDFSYGYPPFAVGPRTMNAPIASYNPSMQQMDAYNGSGSYPGSGYATPVNYQQQQIGGYPSPNGGMPQDEYARQVNGGVEARINQFQGLSLNSR